jgi:hypothetical protein
MEQKRNGGLIVEETAVCHGRLQPAPQESGNRKADISLYAYSVFHASTLALAGRCGIMMLV